MDRNGLIWDEWFNWLMALLVLVIGLVMYALLSGKGSAAIEFMSNLLRFGR